MGPVCAAMQLARSMIEQGERDYKKFQKHMKDEFDLDLDDEAAKLVWEVGGKRFVKDDSEATRLLKAAIDAQRQAVIDVGETTGSEFLLGLYRSGLLASFRPMQASLIGNVGSYTLNSAARLPATFIDYLVGMKTGSRTVTTSGTGEGFKALFSKEAGVNALDVLMHGSDPIKAEARGPLDYRMFGKDPEGAAKIAATVTDPATRALSWWANKVFDVISAADRPGHLAYMKQSLEMNATAKAKSEGLKGKALEERVMELLGPKPDVGVLMKTMEQVQSSNPALAADIKEIVLESRDDIDIGLLQNVTKATKASDTLADSAGFVSRLFLPFTKIPTNAVTQSLEWSPLGMAYGAKELVKAMSRADVQAQKKASLALGRSITGIPLMMFGYMLAQKGMFSEPPPVDQGDRNTFDAAGRQGTSLRIGDKWYSVKDVPQLLPLAAGAMLYRLEQQDKVDGADRGLVRGVADASIDATLRQTLDLPTMKGVSDATKTAQTLSRDARENDSDTKVSKLPILSGLGGSIIPAGVADVLTSTDENRRISPSFADQLSADTPARSSLPLQYDSLGKPVGRQTGVMAQLRGLSPDQEEKLNDPVAQEIYRLGIKNQLPKMVNDPARVDRDATTADYSERQKMYGTSVHDELSAVIQSAWYKQASDPVRKVELQAAIKVAKAQALKDLKASREGRSPASSSKKP